MIERLRLGPKKGDPTHQPYPNPIHFGLDKPNLPKKWVVYQSGPQKNESDNECSKEE